MCFLRHFDLKNDLVLCTKPAASVGDQKYSISKMKSYFREKKTSVLGCIRSPFRCCWIANGGQTELELQLYRTAPYKRAMASKRASSQNRCICH